MTSTLNFLESHYPTDWLQSVHSSNHSFLIPLQDHTDIEAESIRTLFAPSAGALYVYRPSKRRRALNKGVEKLEASCLPGFEYVISFLYFLYDKYRRNHSVSSISQTGSTLHAFLSFYHALERQDIGQIQRKDIAQYVDHEQERGLKINSVRNHLHTVYAFFNYLVINDILPTEVLLRKIRLRLPEVLPKAIPAEDLDRILHTLTSVRNRALIILLLHTGMRGEPGEPGGRTWGQTTF